MAKKLKVYQKRLLGISRRSRCVCLAKIYNKHNFDLTRLDMVNDGISDKIIQSIVGMKSPICVLPNSNDAEDAIQIRAHLKTMYRSIRSAEDETGVQYCYLGFPFFEGRLGRDFYARAPLVLFPVSVYYDTKRSPRGWYVKTQTGEPILNRALFVAMSTIGGFRPSEEFETDFDDLMSSRKEKDFDLVACLAKLLAKHDIPVELDSGPDRDSDVGSTSTIPWRFANKTRDELEQLVGRPFKITKHRIVGSFPQGESAIYKDYESLIATNDKDDFINSILNVDPVDLEHNSSDYGETSDEIQLDAVEDRSLNLVLSSDSSQDAVVLKSQSSEVTLVRGPPGTGKSQVIVNIISNALFRKQTVLVVCQKRAALDVVSQRLAEVGLNKRAVLLDKEDDRVAMYAQILDMLTEPDRYAKRADDLDRTSDEIDRLISSRTKIAAALRDDCFGGIPLQRLYSTSDRTGKKGRLGLDSIIRDLKFSDLANALKSMSEMEPNYKKFETASYPWRQRADFSNLAGTAESNIRDLLLKLKSSSEDYVAARDLRSQERLADLSAQCLSLEKQEADLNTRSGACKSDIVNLLKKSAEHGSSVLEELDPIERRAEIGTSLWDKFGTYQKISGVLDRAITEPSLGRQRKIIEAMQAPRPSIWQKLSNSEIRKKTAMKKDVLARPENADLDPTEILNRLRDGLDLMVLSEDLRVDLDAIRNSTVLNDRNDQDRLIKRVKDARSCLNDLDACHNKLSESLKSLHTLLTDNLLDVGLASDLDRLEKKALGGKSIWMSVSQLSQFFKPDSNPLQDAVSDPKTLKACAGDLLTSLSDFEDLRKHDSRKKDLDKFTLDFLNRCSSQLGLEDDWRCAVEQEVHEAWIEAAEAKHPILRQGFDDYAKYSEVLSNLVSTKSKAVAHRIIHGTRPYAYRSSRLQHELGKKRRIKPVRKLVEEFKDTLFELVPCWLASPEIVSNVFQMKKGMFDLVIVDEASQLAAERAMPFLYRGKRKVIAGDENQLKPHDLFSIKDTDDADVDDDETLSIESLLDLVRMQHPTHMLRWHYRSRWQELIDFSNHAFYSGLLQVAPNVHKNPPDPPILWVDCEGVWENRANLVEAVKVVDEIYRILQDAQRASSDPPTLGVIAFNVGQRDAILDEIETRQDKDPEFARLYSHAESPDSKKKDDAIFIRNIENVQGDEREIIIFSIGYAQDSDGKLRMQFGSLNMQGGENRLNVAVTRASKKIIVVSSIDPDDIMVTSTKNEGPKLLKSFLSYAKAVNKLDHDRVSLVLSQLNSATTRRNSGVDSTPDSASFESYFEEAVYDRLRQHGYEVDTQVGQSGYRIDLAVVNPHDSNKYILGVECDGAQYHSAKSVRERDVHRQKFLERRGWHIHRIWSRDWWRDSNAEIVKIRRKIDSLLDGA